MDAEIVPHEWTSLTILMGFYGLQHRNCKGHRKQFYRIKHADLGRLRLLCLLNWGIIRPGG